MSTLKVTKVVYHLACDNCKHAILKTYSEEEMTTVLGAVYRVILNGKSRHLCTQCQTDLK